MRNMSIVNQSLLKYSLQLVLLHDIVLLLVLLVLVLLYYYQFQESKSICTFCRLFTKNTIIILIVLLQQYYQYKLLYLHIPTVQKPSYSRVVEEHYPTQQEKIYLIKALAAWRKGVNFVIIHWQIQYLFISNKPFFCSSSFEDRSEK